MEVPPTVIHGEVVNPQVNPRGTAPTHRVGSPSGSAASPRAPIDVDDVEIPEEGVCAPPRPRRILFSEIVELRTATLARRRPRTTGDDSLLAAIHDA